MPPNGTAATKFNWPKLGLLPLLVCLVLGVVFIVFGIRGLRNHKINSHWVQTSGQVLSVQPVQGTHGVTYTPLLQYKVGSQSYQITSAFPFGSAPKVGSSQPVAYDPAHPGHAQVLAVTSQDPLAYLFTTLGALLILASLALFVSFRRNN